ncbi:MAG: class I SAM-dependent methyltransferase [Gemmatimonadota bacterium]
MSDSKQGDSVGLVYRNILLYRTAMNVLYKGGYVRRFEALANRVGDARSVCDLCFGDLYLAKWCARRGVDWVGVDLNLRFCDRARRRGFPVVEGDLLRVELPRADVHVMAGSLYHFHDRLGDLLDRVFAKTDRLLLSEPIENVMREDGVIGRLAARVSDPGTGPTRFRYDEPGLLAALEEHSDRIGFNIRTYSRARDLVLEMTRRT